MIEVRWVDGLLPLLELGLTHCQVRGCGILPIVHMVGRLFTVYYLSEIHRLTELQLLLEQLPWS